MTGTDETGTEDEDGTPSEVPNPTTMLRREQQIGFVLAGVVAAASVALAGLAAHNFLAAGAGVAASVVLVFAIRRAHRIFTAIAGFLAGLAFFYFFPIELACLVYSGYLMMRTSNAQAKLRRSQPPMTAAQRRSAAEARAAARAKRRKGDAAVVVSPKSPAPNRRYTPPKSKPSGRR